MPKSSTYTEFVEKFKPKLTTDDCFTPPIVYDVVKAYALRTYGIDEKKTRILRPFRPLGDYKAEDYSGDCIVIDNPPFSILAQIIDYYREQGVRFFLFAPHLSLYNYGSRPDVTAVTCCANIKYENGAIISSSFLTNLTPDVAVVVAGDFADEIEQVQRDAEPPKEFPVYDYPDNVISAARLGSICLKGIYFEILRSQAMHIRALDAQRPNRKAIFGTGFLCSDGIAERLKSERLKSERLKSERLRAEREKEIWELSDREREILTKLNEADS